MQPCALLVICTLARPVKQSLLLYCLFRQVCCVTLECACCLDIACKNTLHCKQRTSQQTRAVCQTFECAKISCATGCILAFATPQVLCAVDNANDQLKGQRYVTLVRCGLRVNQTAFDITTGRHSIAFHEHASSTVSANLNVEVRRNACQNDISASTYR